MPRYDYECSECRVIDEIALPMNHTGVKIECPVCGGEMERVFTPASIPPSRVQT